MKSSASLFQNRTSPSVLALLGACALLLSAKREAELEAIIEDERLRADATRAFIEVAFRDPKLRTTGTAITKVLPPASRFAADGGHGEKKQRVIEKLGTFFERFFGLGSGGNQ